MRVMWVGPPGAEYGGVGRSLPEYVLALVDCGHDVHVVLPTVTNLAEQLSPAAAVHVIHHNRWIGGPTSLSQGTKWMAYNLTRAAPAMAKIMQQAEIEVVVSHTMTTVTGALAAHRMSLPHLWHISEFATAEHGQHYVLGRGPTHAAMRRLTSVSIAVSHAVRDYIRPKLEGVELRVVYQPVNMPVPPRRLPPAHGAGLKLLMLGAISKGKGQVEAVAALGLAARGGAKVTLRIVGASHQPTEFQRLLRTVGSLGLQDLVTIEPFSHDTAELFAAADALLVCSRDEGFGRVSVEAMKSGIPVIGARSGATPEVLNDGAVGWLYMPGDIEGLAATMSRLALDPTGSREWHRRLVTGQERRLPRQDAVRPSTPL